MKKYLLLLVMVVITQTLVKAQTVDRKKHYLLTNGIAIEGYDPVSYFLQPKPQKGKKEFAVVDQGVLYLFSNQNNKDLFLAKPAKYEPAYGGWCAYAMGARGEKVTVDPGTYKIIQNKLYLFYNQYFNNTLKDWNKDEANLMSKADQNWKKISMNP